MPTAKLLVATRNPGKVREYRQLLLGIPFDLVSLDDVGVTQEIEETGHTFAENAALKAAGYGALAGVLTLADDSGLGVDALGGHPGVLSARYGGDPSFTDQDRVNLLLRNLAGVPWEGRTARFQCVLAIWTPPPTTPPQEDAGGHLTTDYQEPAKMERLTNSPQPQRSKPSSADVALSVGSVAGMIQYEPDGDEGFGYDPVFYLPSFRLTMAQLPMEEKNRVSHRANAVGKAEKLLFSRK